MLADQLDYVIGVDPHRDSHAVGVVEVRTGGVVFEASVTADSGGYAEALQLAELHAPGRLNQLACGSLSSLRSVAVALLAMGRSRRHHSCGPKL